MGRREEARAEAAFMRGDVGVDGRSERAGDTSADTEDLQAVEQGAAREQLLRGRTFLGREWLTWLLWSSDGEQQFTDPEGEALEVVFLGRVLLRGLQGEVTELTAKGAMAPYSWQVRRALDEGLLVHSARIRLTVGERSFEATLDAEHLDVRSAKLPALLTEEEDDRLTERLDLAERLSALVDRLVHAFLEVRTSPAWSATVVPELKRWAQQRQAPASDVAAAGALVGAGRAVERAQRLR